MRNRSRSTRSNPAQQDRTTAGQHGIAAIPTYNRRRIALAVSLALLAGLTLQSGEALAGPGAACLDPPPAGTSSPVALSSCQQTIGTFYANSPKLRKFVDTLPGLTAAGANTFRGGQTGQYISLATADTTTYPGSNYYTIAVIEHQQWMHSDLQKPTLQRSYVQVYPQGTTPPAGAVPLNYPDGSAITWPGSNPPEQVWGYDNPHYLGPIILTTTGTPVRIRALNFLPPGRAALDANGKVTARNGDMFLPVDESLPGAGVTPANDKYPQSRVAFHLHGGDSPWISDGTPHQWVTAAGDPSPYKRGDRTTNVPDMPDPGDGGLTLFWPNDQSSRLMWYHDHTFGLTRQNAYSGAAAGYVIIDAAELALLNGGTVNGVPITKAIPGGLLDQLVLVVQDKTFVPDDIAFQDSRWDVAAWGMPGDLWYPHVYEPAVVPDAQGTLVENPAGRWDWGPTMGLAYTPSRLPLPDGSYGQVSATPESYMDTPVVNGVAYPVLKVDPKAYRVRFLNGANDRYFNLSLWVADDSVQSSDGRSNTEVRMVTGDGRPGGVPDPTSKGPSIIQFANEAGLLPAPIVHQPQPMKLDAALTEVAGDFYLAGAERADTVIDFSAYAGKTLILYNDSTAPVPAGDPRYDYYTGDPDQTPFGGAPSTAPGFGPNTRTVMQIVVAPLAAGATAATPYDPAGNGGAMATELPKAFKASVPAHLAPSFNPKLPPVLDLVANTLTLPRGSALPLKVKTIEGFNDPDFGRLIAQIGVELPNANAATPLAYIDKPTDVINHGELQYWLIKNHDGDNHPMHFHLFNVQVVARVDQATGALKGPEADELGWKETVKNWPGEDVVVAMQPKTPQLPFGLPNSVRLLDPTLAAGATTNTALFPPGTTTASGTLAPYAFTQLDLTTGLPVPAATPVINTIADFGWEYVWHCHILGHEENDLMRPLVFRPVLNAPAAPTAVQVAANGLVSWTDPTPAAAATTKGNAANEVGFRVERALVTNGKPTTFAALAKQSPFIVPTVNTLANATSLQDVPATGSDFAYRVVSVNQAGEAASTAAILTQVTPVAATALKASTLLPRVITLTWTDSPANETGYVVQRSTASINAQTGAVSWGTPGNQPTATALLPAHLSLYIDSPLTVAADTLYRYQVHAVNGPLAAANSAAVPAASFNALATLAQLQAQGGPTSSTLGVQWQASASTLATGYEVQRCIGTATTCAASTAVWTAAGSVAGGANSHFVNSGLTTRTGYAYRVRAVNSVLPTLASPWSKLLALKTL
jgi:FtsP/CotA-like multicopper oxidase with cupredoxin domain